MCRDGRLKVGDRVLEINGADATKVPLAEAYEMLSKSDATITLLVEYNVSVIGQFSSDNFHLLKLWPHYEFQLAYCVVFVDWFAFLCSEAVENATGPLLVEIDRPFCCSLGVHLASATFRGRTVISIRNIVPASIADRYIIFYIITQAHTVELPASSVHTAFTNVLNVVSRLFYFWHKVQKIFVGTSDNEPGLILIKTSQFTLQNVHTCRPGYIFVLFKIFLKISIMIKSIKITASFVIVSQSINHLRLVVLSSLS